MNQPIGIRLPKEIMEKIDKISKKEFQDRSTIIRKLVLIGYLEFIKQKSTQDYIEGKITLSKAAHESGLTIWEMEKYLVEHGFKSSYSIEDLQEEMKILDS